MLDSDFPNGRDYFRAQQHIASALVLRHVSHGFDSLRHIRKTDSTRNRSHLQNRLADVSPDSLVALRTRDATGGIGGGSRRNVLRWKAQRWNRQADARRQGKITSTRNG